ncbi:Predicted PurR-regulated permease PerM [Seinonella peptonophila]|uniref:Predicted PurR-regulated permease PerM n=1 Tax=Seinonella peptonophila TaxID=112248 RepID=A0A1M4W9X2_9BACL|nr:AI-2E family transporter [Seinonella peptonophila]SHE78026.1 Predicted PurR-regulated permease PerM [Seinonella peptonophila]
MKEWRLLIIALITLSTLAILYLLFKMSPYLTSIFRFLEAVISPFLIALIISYLLNPIVNLLSQKGIPRWIAVLAIYSLFITSVMVVIINMLPLFEQQLNELIEHLPRWNQQIQYMIHEYNHHSRDILPDSIQNAVQRSLTKMEGGIGHWVDHMMEGIGNTINHLFFIIIIPFLAFYMMRDSNQLERGLINLLPQQKRKEITRLCRDIDRALGNYIRGQLLVSIVVGLFVYFGYLFIGLPYPMILALVVAICNVIPYLGPFLGALPAAFVAFTVSTKLLISVLIVNLIVQIIEGNVLSPQIVGKTLHMHPLTIIFALLVGGEVGGVWGLILAVPIFAIGKVIGQHILAHYVRIKV